jgi:hypothetical protein
MIKVRPSYIFFDKLTRKTESGKAWTTMNEGALYRTLSVPSGNITSSCKKIARNKVQSGYALRPSIWSDESEPTYVKRNVKVLTAESPFPPRYIFGQDEDGNWHAFEHEVLRDVVLNVISELGYQPHVEELDSIFCTAAVAVCCALKELSRGTFVDFSVPDFKPKYERLMEYIRDVIYKNAELSARWKAYKLRILLRLSNICGAK